MNESEEVDLFRYLDIVRRRLWVPVLVTLLAVGVSGTLSLFVLPEVYAASTSLIVSRQDTPVDYTTVLLNQQLVTTYSEIAKSRSVAEQVISDLDLRLTVQAFRSKVRVKTVRDTQLLEITVEDDNPYSAAAIADGLSRVFVRRVAEIMKVQNVAVVDAAVVPTEPIRPRPVLDLLVAGVLGLGTGVLLAFVLEYLDNTVETTDDVQRYLHLPVLAAIPIVDAEMEGISRLGSEGRTIGGQSHSTRA